MKQLTETTAKVKKKEALTAARQRGIWNWVEVARRVPCSLTSVHLVWEKPSRYPRVRRRIKELTGV